MRRAYRAMIAVGLLLLGFVLLGAIVGAATGPTEEYRNGRYVESGTGLSAVQVVVLVVAVLLILVAVIQHQADRRRGDGD